MNKLKPIIIVAAAIIIIIGVFYAYNSTLHRTEISEFELTASAGDAVGVEPGSRFLLKSSTALSPQVIEKYLSITPKVDFTVTKLAQAEVVYEIIPKVELVADQVYTIGINKGPLASRDFNWAYQVKAPFQVSSSLPRDKSNTVPLNTGIEIYFNRDDLINPEKFIEISPAIVGTFDVKGNRVRFIPKNPLNTKTIYTIKVKPGLQAKNTQDVHVTEKIIQFETDEVYLSKGKPSVYIPRKFFEFKPNADVLLEVSAHETDSVNATVYRFNSAEEFIESTKGSESSTSWTRYAAGNSSLKIPDNKKVFSGKLPIETQERFTGVRLPQRFENGYYAVILEIEDSKDVAWFQINPAASFIALASEKSLIWIKNIADGRALAGVPIAFEGNQVGQTGSDGVAFFNTPSVLIRKSEESSYTKRFFTANFPTGKLIIPVENEYGYDAELNQNDEWWEYISVNKNIYLPTDIVRFWALQKPRSGELKAGEKIKVQLTNPYWINHSKDTVLYGELELPLSEYGSVTGEIPFKNLRPGIYELSFMTSGKVISKQTISVGAYIKPAYKIIVTPDKNVLFTGETVNFKVRAEFFDGTPLANSRVSYSIYWSSSDQNKKGEVNLNAQGEGTFAFSPGMNASSYSPTYLSVNVRPSLAEEGQIEANTTLFVFGPRVKNNISEQKSSTENIFSVKTRAVVINDRTQVEPYWDTESYLGAAVAGVTTQVDRFEVVYIKEQTRTFYNPITKLTSPVYSYRTEEVPISTQTITADSNGVARFSFTPELKKTYMTVFTTKDGFGNQTVDTRYTHGIMDEDTYSYDESVNNTLYLNNADGTSNKNYKIGETINLQLQKNDDTTLPEKEGGFVFITVNNGNFEYTIQNSPNFNSIFQAKDVPNIAVWSGWFDNGRFHNTYPYNISFDANERRLNLNVKKDKQTYAPGEMVNLDIKVVDKNNRPVKAEVNISALDQAVFSINPEEKDIVNDFYKDNYSQVIIRSSNKPPYGGGGAEKGGGGDGDGSPRSNINEVAIFKTVTTDASGYARVTFKLPDNITSWRLTTQAITKDDFAGKSIEFIPVTLPFFVDMTLNTTYLAGDDLSLRLRTYGPAAMLGSTRFSVESASLPFGKIDRVAQNNVEIPIGKLTVGNHTITARASSDIHKDALTRPISVLNSYFAKNSFDVYKAKDGLKITNTALGNTTLTFSSYGKGMLYTMLKSLSYEWGTRLDQKGAQLAALTILNESFGEKNEIPESNIHSHQDYSGGLTLFPYSSEEIELTAIAAHLFSDNIVNRSLMNNYFNKAVNITDEKQDITAVIRGLFGLTASRQPVLTKLQTIKKMQKLDIGNKVFLALALDKLGAKEEARSYYKEDIRPSIDFSGSFAFVTGLDEDKTVTITALTAALAASLEEPESINLIEYVKQHAPKETLSNFEMLFYIKTALPKLDSSEVKFAYRAGSKRGAETLKNGEIFSMTLSPEELSNLELSGVSGNLAVGTLYEQASSAGEIFKDKNLGVTRVYEVNGVSTKEFKDGDMVVVKLYPQFSTSAANGIYQLTDYLPSGLRAIDQTVGRYGSEYNRRLYPSEINNQRVTFVVNRAFNLPIYYNARVISKGTYKAESATIQSLYNLSSINASNEETVTIK